GWLERRRRHEGGGDDDWNRGEPRCRYGPRRALVCAGVDADEEQAEAERRDDCEPGSGSDATTSVPTWRSGEDDDARDDERHSDPLPGRGHVSPRCVHRKWNDRRRCRDRSDDPHRAYGEAAVESAEAD